MCAAVSNDSDRQDSPFLPGQTNVGVSTSEDILKSKDSERPLRSGESNVDGKGTEKDEKRTTANLKGEKRKHVVIVGSALLNIFLIILNALTIGYMSSEVPGEKRNSPHLCLDCSQLKLHPNDSLELYDVHTGNVCCVKSGGNYSSMVKKLVTKKLQDNLISESPKYQPLFCGSRESAVIKLVGKKQIEKTPASDSGSLRYPWLQWDTEMNNKAGLTADDTHITINRTGVYQIYSQLVFQNRIDKGPSSYSMHPDRYFLHAIYKMSSSVDEQKLLGGSYTYFQYQNGETEVTSYIGSPYQLRKGDKLGVKVHDVLQVVPNNVTNFFGVYQIQQTNSSMTASIQSQRSFTLEC